MLSQHLVYCTYICFENKNCMAFSSSTLQLLNRSLLFNETPRGKFLLGKLQFIPFIMKLDSCTSRFCRQSNAVLSRFTDSHCESGLNHRTRLWDTLGNIYEFGPVPRDPAERHTNTVGPRRAPHPLEHFPYDSCLPKHHEEMNPI
jgi:hypothetical protein